MFKDFFDKDTKNSTHFATDINHYTLYFYIAKRE